MTSQLALDYDKFLDIELPERSTLLGPWLPTKGLGLVHAMRGVGKTHFVIGVGHAVATGTGFLKWNALSARRVLLVDGEMPARSLQDRINSIIEHTGKRPQPQYLRVLAADLSPNGLPDLADVDSHDFYLREARDADLVVLDNLSTLCNSMQENDAAAWGPVQSFILTLRRAGKSALLVHHDGKSGAQRGTSKKEDVLDSVIALKHPPDYRAEQGARFQVRFGKARGFVGEESEPFEAHLKDGVWSINELTRGDDLATILALRKDGCSIRDIADRTGISKSAIGRTLQEAEQAAELDDEAATLVPGDD